MIRTPRDLVNRSNSSIKLKCVNSHEAKKELVKGHPITFQYNRGEVRVRKNIDAFRPEFWEFAETQIKAHENKRPTTKHKPWRHKS